MDLIEVIFCVDAEELQIMQRTDSSRMNYRDGYMYISIHPVSFSLTVHV